MNLAKSYLNFLLLIALVAFIYFTPNLALSLDTNFPSADKSAANPSDANNPFSGLSTIDRENKKQSNPLTRKKPETKNTKDIEKELLDKLDKTKNKN